MHSPNSTALLFIPLHTIQALTIGPRQKRAQNQRCAVYGWVILHCDAQMHCTLESNSVGEEEGELYCSVQCTASQCIPLGCTVYCVVQCSVTVLQCTTSQCAVHTWMHCTLRTVQCSAGRVSGGRGRMANSAVFPFMATSKPVTGELWSELVVSSDLLVFLSDLQVSSSSIHDNLEARN